jgi:hypothetical protein
MVVRIYRETRARRGRRGAELCTAALRWAFVPGLLSCSQAPPAAPSAATKDAGGGVSLAMGGACLVQGADAGAHTATAPFGDPTIQPGLAAPANALTLVANPLSALSELGCISAPLSSEVRVRSTDGSGTSVVTPYVPIGPGGVGAVSILGLAPSTAYKFSVEALADSGAVAGPSLSLTTAALPADLTANVAITGTASSAFGYYLVSGAGKYAIAFDGAGLLRWYRGFSATTGETKMQQDGTFTAYVGTSTGSEAVAGQYVRFTPDGAEIASYSPVSPDPTAPSSPTVYTDPHEMLITPVGEGDERIHMMGYTRMPRSATDSTPAAWHQLQRIEPDGSLEFQWRVSDHFTADDQGPEFAGVADIDHANAFVIDPADGNYVISFRHLDAIVKVDYDSGEIIWQLGGKKNQFTLVGDPLGGFQGQHSVRLLPGGHILIYDNGVGHSPQESRAVEYALDTSAMTATMVWQYRHSPPIFTLVTGSVERLSNGNTLVAFAHVGVVDEVAPDGHVVWEAQLTNGTTAAPLYRIRRLPSLYSFETP